MDFTSEELKLKKILIYLISFLLTGFIGIFVFYGGWTFSVKDISGCYYLSTRKYVDKVCLYRDGEYKQFFSKAGSEPQQYNSNSWRKFSYSNGSRDFFAGSLYEFVTRDNAGEVDSLIDIDIQPYRNMFGNVLFTRGVDSSGNFREYHRE